MPRPFSSCARPEKRSHCLMCAMAPNGACHGTIPSKASRFRTAMGTFAGTWCRSGRICRISPPGWTTSPDADDGMSDRQGSYSSPRVDEPVPGQYAYVLRARKPTLSSHTHKWAQGLCPLSAAAPRNERAGPFALIRDKRPLTHASRPCPPPLTLATAPPVAHRACARSWRSASRCRCSRLWAAGRVQPLGPVLPAGPFILGLHPCPCVSLIYPADKAPQVRWAGPSTVAADRGLGRFVGAWCPSTSTSSPTRSVPRDIDVWIGVLTMLVFVARRARAGPCAWPGLTALHARSGTADRVVKSTTLHNEPATSSATAPENHRNDERETDTDA